MNTTTKTIVWVSIFAVAMGLFESAVVVYLRELYYADGFRFPLQPIPVFIGRIEVFREAATIIMLVACGIIAGNTKLQRFAYFVLAFAIWDLFYYVFLWIFISWPQSLSTWDILFLIPAPWVGPVWAPCLLCLLMITGSLYIIHQTKVDPTFRVESRHWMMMITGALICIFSFMWDYLLLISGKSGGWNLFSQSDLFSELETYVPTRFNSGLFFTGFLLMCSSVLLSVLSARKQPAEAGSQEK